MRKSFLRFKKKILISQKQVFYIALFKLFIMIEIIEPCIIYYALANDHIT